MSFLNSLTNLAKTAFGQRYAGSPTGGGGSWGPKTEADKQFSISRKENLPTAGFQINSPVANFQGQALNNLNTGSVYGPTRPMSVPQPTIQQIRAPQIQNNFGKMTPPAASSIVQPNQVSALNTVVNQARNNVSPTGGLTDFTSTDQNVLNRLAEMSRQAEANSSMRNTTTTNTTNTTNNTTTGAGLTTGLGVGFGVGMDTGADTLSELQKAYLGTLEQSQAEKDAQARLNDIIAQQANLNASEELGINKIRDQAIAMPFITGQSASLQRSVAGQMGALGAQTTPLVNQLAAAQAARQATGDRTMAELEFEMARQASMQPDIKEVGGALVQYNPATGQYQEVYRSPSEASKPIALGEGQILVDPVTGQQIATGLPKSTSASTSAPKIEDIYGVPHMWNPDTGRYEKLEQPIGASQISGTMQYALDKAKNTTGFIDEALGMANWTTTGLVGALNKYIPGTQATDLKGVIDTIAGNIGFAELTAMRAASPTGGALGQVSDREIGLLTSVLGSLKQSQSTEQVKANLQKIKQHLTNWQDTVELSSVYGANQNAGAIANAVSEARASNPALARYSASKIAQALGFNTASGQALNSPANSLNVPAENKTVKTSMGQAIITGYGSKYWKPGLDIVFPGGKTAPVAPPSDFTVVDIKQGYNGGFGNQVKIRDAQGNEMWFSHLDVLGGLQKGGFYKAGTPVGIQGNTGKTYGVTGIHVDITMPKPGGGYYDAKQVAAYLNAKT